MILHKRPSLILLIILSVSTIHAQVRQDIRPRSFLVSARLFTAPAEVSYTFDMASATDLDMREDKAGHMPRFARSIPTDISLTHSGSWTTLPGGDRVWRVRVSAPGALALIPCYDEFHLPAGATLHVYTPAKDEVIGAFTAGNNPKDGRYNTGLIYGDACIIEYYEPAAVSGQGRIHLNELGYAYRMVPARKESQSGGIGFDQSESCEVNVRCPEGNDWQDQKNAIVRVMVKTGNSYGWCSGSMVNNVNQDCTPYILSADHCYQDDVSGQISTASDLSQWLFYFQYESPSCADPVSQGVLGNNVMTGCTFCAASLDTGGNSGSDFVLLKLNSAPPVSYIPYYAGWSNINAASPSGVGIHHPDADIKKISTYRTALTSVSWGGEVANTHWQILWAQTINGNGVTEPGSSGSPIFDPGHHIVGTLTGGGSDCTTPTQNDYYGKFSYHWTSNGTTSNKRLQSWLDPSNTGATTLDGKYAPCSTSVALDAAITSVAQDSAFCSSSISPICILTNYGSATLTSDSLTVDIDGGNQKILWTGSLSSLQSTQVMLPTQNLSVGSHTITVTSSAPNGGIDGNTANNSASSNITVVASSGEYSYYMQTGDQGSAITWEIADQDDNILYSGGPYTNNVSGQTINQSWCLPMGCYTFTVFSSLGDGLAGSSLAGTFTIKNASGTTIAQLQQADFGTKQSFTVCQPQSLGINSPDASLTHIDIYPNPSTGIYTITNAQNATSLTVSDELGRVIMTSSWNNEATHQIDLSSEESGVYFFKFSSEQGNTVKKVVLNTGR
jgi:hypothetical protein